MADGTLRVDVERVYPLAQVKEALAHAARPGRAGKVLLAPNA
jgi:NADPH:quinone reductase-like Zn-dependent oxidoreductase